jgi:predicted ATPase/DNA-binding SARP family transcriptional activator/tetratricopeptide (TPR) repeat protein
MITHRDRWDPHRAVPSCRASGSGEPGGGAGSRLGRVRIRLLGGFGVERDGAPVAAQEWRLRKARTLVKLLALAPGQRLHREVLLETLWPGKDAAAALNNLHQALHVARRALAGEGDTGDLLKLRDDVVALHVGGLVDVDVREFESLRDEPRKAIAKYSGDLLPEDRFEPWAADRREELRRLYCELLVDVGEPETLARALAIDPLHERAVRGVMRQLGDEGRRSEALARYEQLRDDLGKEFGTDPDPETRELYRSLLHQTRNDNLGEPLTSFIGREREITEVHRLLGRGGLLTLTGVGGAGKTRLAEEAARREIPKFPDGVWFAELARVADPRLVPDTVAAALGLDPAAGANALRTLVARLAGKTLLLVLDNCEHLLTACADLAVAVRRSCPGVTLLATSREPLHVPGEVTFRVPSLEVPDGAGLGDLPSSMRLFVERACDVRPDFVLDQANAPDIAEICRRLDGIPLALELAAARMSHLEPAEIAERLTGALSLLGAARGDVTRHATLRAALDWSHALLSGDEQALLRRLAVFAGSFSLAAAEGICADADVLGRLVDKSLVQVERAGDRSRYRLLETIRQLARERLVAAGEVQAYEAAHCRYFTRLAVDSDPDGASGVVVERPQWLDIDHDNLRAALGWAARHDPDQALLLGVSLWRYWLARGHLVEGAGWLERILAVAGTPSPMRARAYFALAILEARKGLGARLRPLADAAVADAERSGGEPEDARLMRGTLLLGIAATDEVEEITRNQDNPVARWLSALAALFREDVGEAKRRLTGCLIELERADRSERPFLPAVSACVTLIPLGDTTIPVFEESWLLGRRVGAVQGHAYAQSLLAYAHRLHGDLPAAAETAARAVDEFARIDDPAGLAHALNHLGCIERDARHFEPAGKHLREARRLREQLGDRRSENLSLANLGLLSAAAGDPAGGRRLAGTALDRALAVDDGPGTGGALLNLAVVELFAGDRERARTLTERASRSFESQGYLRVEAWTRLLAAELGGAEEHGEKARVLFRRLGCHIGLPRSLKAR